MYCYFKVMFVTNVLFWIIFTILNHAFFIFYTGTRFQCSVLKQTQFDELETKLHTNKLIKSQDNPLFLNVASFKTYVSLLILG